MLFCLMLLCVSHFVGVPKNWGLRHSSKLFFRPSKKATLPYLQSKLDFEELTLEFWVARPKFVLHFPLIKGSSTPSKIFWGSDTYALKDPRFRDVSKNLAGKLTEGLLITPASSFADPNHRKSVLRTSLVAHWKPAMTESLISLRYWTPLVQSIRMLGPLVSGPKHQIFLKVKDKRVNKNCLVKYRLILSCNSSKNNVDLLVFEEIKFFIQLNFHENCGSGPKKGRD